MNKTVAVHLLAPCASTAPPVPHQDQAPVRAKSPQSAYLGHPCSSDDVVSPIDISLSYAHRSVGYYTDVDNEYKTFHVCKPVLFSDGKVAMMLNSFVCPKATLFDQQTCTIPPGTALCVLAERFYNLDHHVRQGGTDGVPVASPPVLAEPKLQRAAVLPEPKREVPVNAQQEEDTSGKAARVLAHLFVCKTVYFANTPVPYISLYR